MAHLLLASIIPLFAIATPILQNITILAPQGASNHGDPRLLCTPTRSIDIALFFLGNYVAHAATVKTQPGEPLIPGILDLLLALLFPVAGITRGLNAIYQAAALRQLIFKKTPLETAVRSGAVCEVIRTELWRPRSGDFVRNVEMQRPFEVPPDNANSMRRPGLPRPGLSPLRPVVPGRDQGLLEPIRAPSEPDIQPVGPGDYEGGVESGTLVVAEISTESPFFFHQSPSFPPANGLMSITGRNVHGRCNLPSGYALAAVPIDSEIYQLQHNRQRLNNVPNQHSWSEEDDLDAELDVVVQEASEQSAWRSTLGWVLNFLFGTHRYLEKLEARQRADMATEKDIYLMEKLRRLEKIAPLPPLLGDRTTSSLQLSSYYSFSKGLIAVIQLVFASFTIYSTRGDQITRYGYAAFGLTAAPYLIMSSVNLLSSVLTPSYSHVYLVDSEILREAKDHGGRFEGVIGTLEPPERGQGEEPEPSRTFGQLSSTFDVLFEVHRNGWTVAYPVSGAEDLSELRKMDRRGRESLRLTNLSIFFRVTWARLYFEDKSPSASSRRGILGPLTPRFISIISYFIQVLRAEMRTVASGSFPKLTQLRQAWLAVRDQRDQSNFAIPTTTRRIKERDRTMEFLRTMFVLYGSIFIGCLSIAVVGGLSHFHHGSESTLAQRAWTMSWLATGIFVGPAAYLYPTFSSLIFRDPIQGTVYKLGLFLYAAPAIGGFVVVSQMLSNYGHCVQIY